MRHQADAALLLDFGNGWFQFGSSHPGGITAALADGSVHRIMYNVQTTAFKNLTVRDDGAVLPPGTID